MRPVLTVILYTALTAAALHAQNFPRAVDDLNRRGDGVTRLELWVNAVQVHRAGISDEASRRIGSCTLNDLDNLTIELQSLLKLMDEPRGDSFSAGVDSGRTSGLRRVL